MTSTRIAHLILSVALIALSLLPAVTTSKTIHSEKSMYRNIVVRENSGLRCLVFTVMRGDRNQTCMDLKDPRLMVFPYTRMVFAGLLANPSPQKILVVGLGGGSIPTTLHELFPSATIDIVEIDSAVVKVAREFFAFSESDRMHVDVQDARVFVKRAMLKESVYDLIILDAFTGEYIPEHLMTLEFLQEVRSILSPGGVLVANTFSNSDLYHHESVTYRAAFGPFLNFKLPEAGNRVIIATIQPLSAQRTMALRAAAYAESLAPYGIKITDYPAHLSREIDWDSSKRSLTDQFSPANLLRDRN
jgi:spermidine synthase